jgi:predicted metal-binding transcription factor (methanogenesis marker protein 9)
MATVLKSYDKWKQFLGQRVSQAELVGMSEETITKLAFQIGEYLQDKIDPENDEERVLKELWDVGNEQERKTLAHLMVKLVNK